MDELLMVLPAGLVAVPIFALMQRSYRHLAPAPLWAGAWCALFVAGLLGSPQPASPALRFFAGAVSALFAALLLAGTLEFTRHRLAGRVFPASWVWIGGAGIVGALSAETGAVMGAVASAAAITASAALVWKRARRVGAGVAEHTLAGAFLLVGLFTLASGAPRESVGDGFVPAWIVLASTTAAVQLVVFVERSHARQRSLLQARRVLARIAETATSGSDLGIALGELASRLPGTGSAPFFGVWLVEGEQLRLFASSGTLPGLTGSTGPVPLRGNRYVERLEKAPGPLLYDDLRADPWLRDFVRSARIDRAAASAIRSAEGELTGVLAVVLAPWAEHDHEVVRFIQDLAEVIGRVLDHRRIRQAAERGVRDVASSRRNVAALVSAVPVGLLVTDREARVQLINDALKQQLALDPSRDWQARTAAEVFGQVLPALDPISRAAVEGLVQGSGDKTRSLPPFELRLGAQGGRILRLSTTPVTGPEGEKLGRVWVSQDVTSERHVTDRLLQADQLETLGTLAGGLAHDFNNQLTGILGNAHLLLADLPASDARREAIEDLQRSAEHCADLTRRLLTFANPTLAKVRASADLERLLSELEPLARRMLPDKVRLDVHVDPSTPRAAGDAGQLRRVLFNLIVNARDAVGEAGAIEVSVRPRNRLGPIEIVVTDDGVGIPEALQARVFDPLFTTKEASLGTGLGLAVVRDVAEAHGAEIQLRSEPGVGSVFTLLWPAAELAHPRPSRAGPDPGLARGTVLIAEDEPGVRRMAQRALERAGYRVLLAEDGEAACARFEALADEIDLLLFDLSMPGMDGLTALARVRAQRPGLPAIVMSGHPDQGRARPWPRDVPLLPKPFGPEMLLAQVGQALGRRA